MKTFKLGEDVESGEAVYFPKDAYRTHVHLPGGTGKGKTTALLAMQQAILKDRFDDACHINIDFLGGWTDQLLLWMASRWCPQRVRDRLVPGFRPQLAIAFLQPAIRRSFAAF